jgi:tetratricopeptide (TPR) repeat protein
MSDTRDFKIDASDEARVTAIGGDVKAEVVNFGDRYESNAPREITVSGVGDNPPNFQTYWVDRATYQTALTDRIAANPVTEILADGGFGKSSLAAWAYEYLGGEFKHQFWVNFGQAKSFDRFARWVLQEIGLVIKDPQATEQRLLDELVYRLNISGKTLVVMDQLEAIAQADDWQWFERFLTKWAADGKVSRVLVTTQSRILTQDPIALGGLNVAEGTVFFEREGLTGDRFPDLIDLAGGHPLLLKLAATWTRETYGARVDDRAIDFFGKLFANYRGDPTEGVAAIFGVIFEELPIGLQDLLCGVSVYRLPFGEAMAQAIAASATIGDLELLGDRGLLLRQGEAFVLHPLVAELVRSRVSEAVRVAGHEGAIAYYSAHFQDWDGTIDSCRAELEVFYHAYELGQYQRAYKVLSRCVNQLDRSGQWRSLLPLYVRLTTEWQAADDIEARNLGGAWMRLGNLYRQLGDYQRAIAAHQKAQEISNQIDFTQGQAASLGNLGTAYQSLGQYQRAIDFHQQSLEIDREIGDRNGEARSLGNLGIAYKSLKQYQRAIDFYQQSLEIDREIGDRWWEGASLRNMGLALGNLNRLPEALDYFQQAKAIFTELQLDHMIEPCDGNIQSCQQAIDKSQRDQHLQLFLLWFAFGLAIMILIYWLRR